MKEEKNSKNNSGNRINENYSWGERGHIPEEREKSIVQKE